MVRITKSFYYTDHIEKILKTVSIELYTYVNMLSSVKCVRVWCNHDSMTQCFQ